MRQFPFAVALTSLAALLTLTQLQHPHSLYLAAAGAISCALTLKLIPGVSSFMLRKNIFGFDLNKEGTRAGEKKVPECVGFAGAVAFVMVGMVTGVMVKFVSEDDLPTYWAMFVTIMGTILLGFADDMLDLPWRYKLIFPFFIVLPLVAAYSGPTHLEVIWPFSGVVGPTLALGPLFLLYIVLLSIYLTNTINIFAGINGLEVGQSIVAACSMLLYFYLRDTLHHSESQYL